MIRIEELNIKGEQQTAQVHPFLDKWGPERIEEVHDSELGIDGILIIDNTSLGPGCGGIKISSTVTHFNTFQLARSTTWKGALFDIPLGGASAGIKANPAEIDKLKCIRAFAHKVASYVPERYIAAPGMNTGKLEMCAFAEELRNNSSATGKPESLGGIPYELGVIGFGVGVAVETVVKTAHSIGGISKNLSEVTIGIRGWGRVGCEVAKYITNKKARVVAICDSWGGCYNSKGLDISKTLKYACAESERKSVKSFKLGTTLSKDEFMGIECDLIILTDWEPTLDEKKAKLIKAKCVVEGSDNSVPPDVEQILHKCGIFVVPDILATAGGVISSYAECNSWSSNIAFSVIEAKIEERTKLVIQQALESKTPPRTICIELAQSRISGAVMGENNGI